MKKFTRFVFLLRKTFFEAEICLLMNIMSLETLTRHVLFVPLSVAIFHVALHDDSLRPAAKNLVMLILITSTHAQDSYFCVEEFSLSLSLCLK